MSLGACFFVVFVEQQAYNSALRVSLGLRDCLRVRFVFRPTIGVDSVAFLEGSNVWVYDGRSNVPRIAKKDRPLTGEHSFFTNHKSVRVHQTGKET
jgi:hypothetical protein